MHRPVSVLILMLHLKRAATMPERAGLEQPCLRALLNSYCHCYIASGSPANNAGTRLKATAPVVSQTTATENANALYNRDPWLPYREIKNLIAATASMHS